MKNNSRSGDQSLGVADKMAGERGIFRITTLALAGCKLN